MKILHIINSLGGGGAEKLIIETSPLLIEKGNNVDILLLNGEKTFFYEELEKQHICQIFSLGNSFYNPLYIFKIIPFLSKYELIHVHLFPCMYFVAIAKMLSLKKVKLIFTEHNTSNRRLAKIALRPLEKFIYSFYQKIICITPEVKDELILKLGIKQEKLAIIENGINLEKVMKAVKSDRSKFGYTDGDVLLIMVAAFREQKDQDTVINTLTELPANYKLLLVGDGIRKSHLETLALKLKVAERINFMGFRSDVYALYKMCNIAILSSHWEGFGLASVEAMASGTPIIASDVNGLNNVVKGGGLLFEKGNVKELKNRILELVNDSEFYKKVSVAGLQKSSIYSISKNVDKLTEVYNQVNIK